MDTTTARNSKTNGLAVDTAAPPLPRAAPHNIQLEQALLGAILLDNAAYAAVAPLVDDADFFDPLHEKIFGAIAETIEAGRRADPVTLKARFAGHKPIGPGMTVPQYLGHIVANVPTTINRQDYARQVRELAARRRMIVALEDGAEAAYDVAQSWPDAARHSAATVALIAGEAQEADGSWPAPDMTVLRRSRVAPPPFPLDVLSDAGQWVETAAASKSAPVDYVALDLLVVAAGVIGAKRRVSPWPGWDEPSILWGVSVGEPSSNKSPAADPLRDAVRAVEAFANRDFAEINAEYETEKKKADAHRAEWENRLAAAVKAKQDIPPMPDTAAEPKRPSRHRLWAVDCTSEQLARLLGDSPSGLICFRDELAGLLGGFDRYGGSGSDRAFWLEAYGGRSYRYDRVGLKGESIDIPFCAVSLLGGVQPDRLDSLLLTGDDDGLAARPLYAWPDPVQSRRPTRVADRSALQRALQRLHDIKFSVDEDGMFRARVVPLEPDAADEFQAWWEGRQWDARNNAAGRVAGAIGKLDGVTLRIAMTLEFLSWAWSGSNAEEPSTVSMMSITNAMRIVDGWVRPTLGRVFAEASLQPADRAAMTVARWLLDHQPTKINAKATRRSAGFTGPKDPKALDEALAVLVDAGWLRPAGTREGGTKGRASKDFDVNPRIYNSEGS
jgi:hypothetical protein